MLLALSPMVAVALERAREARERAATAAEEDDRHFWREMERRWMKLAQSYEAVARTDAFTDSPPPGRLH